MQTAIERPQRPATTPLKGRGAVSNRESRFNRTRHEADHDLESDCDETAPEPVRPTEIRIELARSIISSNQSPDIPFDRSINPYRGCEHGCVYCYARPTHAYLGLSPGLDFETRIFAKTNAATLLRSELARSPDRDGMIALGANTDPYQPAEKRYGITRELLEVAVERGQRIGITTKSALVVRDIDLLRRLAGRGLVHVLMSVATLDRAVTRTLEPRANSPARRIEAIARLSEAGIPTGVLVAPLIPALTDRDMERVLEAAADAGARTAGYVVLRLPLEVAGLFREWLQAHYPLRAQHVMSLVQQMRHGKDNDSNFGSRMRGSGLFADLIERRFRIACNRLGLNHREPAPSQPQAPVPAPQLPVRPAPNPQLPLFD